MTTIKAKNVSRRPNISAGAIKSVRGADGAIRCGACNGEIVQVTANGRMACFDCGKEAI